MQGTSPAGDSQRAGLTRNHEAGLLAIQQAGEQAGKCGLKDSACNLGLGLQQQLGDGGEEQHGPLLDVANEALEDVSHGRPMLLQERRAAHQDAACDDRESHLDMLCAQTSKAAIRS